MQFRTHGNTWGTHRVLDQEKCLPQSANRLDASLPLYDNEIEADVSALHLDAASFHHLKSLAATHQPQNQNDFIKEIIFKTVQERGKMHNPHTNSGGVFLGEVRKIGPQHPMRGTLKEGDRIVSLVSLTLTPLYLKAVNHVDLNTGEVSVSGTGILFASGMLSLIPDDLSQRVVMAALDICGAPAQLERLCRKGDRILIVGLGKAGRSLAAQAELMGLKIYGVDADEKSVSWCRKNLNGFFERFDAKDPLAVSEWIEKQTEGKMVDAALHVTNVDTTEMAAILPCREGGKVLFFGMQTSFQKAVLGAEGIGKDVTLLMGSGYVPGHAELMLNLLRKHQPLRQWFEEHYG